MFLVDQSGLDLDGEALLAAIRYGIEREVRLHRTVGGSLFEVGGRLTVRAKLHVLGVIGRIFTTNEPNQTLSPDISSRVVDIQIIPYSTK